MFGADLTYNLYIDNGLQQGAMPSQDLPRYLVPTFRNQHPWNRISTNSNLESDFILIAEFSELEGPRPVITIPTETVSDFNVTDFTVRIMSLDHQTTTSHGFHMLEDSQVLISETRDNIFAFVHHFALYDRHARGFVRPFAISYVTPDHRKLMYFFEEISQHLKKVTRYLKYGNKLMFKNELESYVLDLQYTKAQMLLRHRKSNMNSSVDSDDIVFRNLKTLESNLAETIEILKVIKPALTDKRVEQRFCRLEEKAKVEQKRPKSDSFSFQEFDSTENHTTELQSGSLGTSTDLEDTLFPDNKYYKPRIIKISSGRKFDIHLRGIHELCSWGAKEGLQRLRHMYQYFKRDMAVLQAEKSDIPLTDPLSGLLTFGTDCIAANMMSNIDQNCVGAYCYSKRLDYPGFHRWSSIDTLESFKSLDSSYKSLSDDTESMLSADSHLGSPRSLSEELKALEIIGSDQSLRELYSLGIMSHERLKCLLHQTEGLSDDYDTQLDVTLGEPVSSDSSSLPENKSENPNGINSNDLQTNGHEYLPEESKTERSETLISGTDVLSTNHNHIDILITEELQTGDDYYSKDKEDVSDNKSDCGSESQCSTSNQTKKMSNHINQGTIMKEQSMQSTQRLCDTPCDNDKVQEVKEQVIDRGQEVNDQGDFNGNNDSPKTGSTFSRTLQRELSTGEMTDRSTPTSIINSDIFISDDTPEPVSSGCNLLKLMNTYTMIQNVIYSVLIGRTVFVVGSYKVEEEGKDVVKALKVFVPGLHRNSESCISWTSKVPQLVELSHVKLAGICRPERKTLDRLIPKAVKRLVTIIDLEKRMIHSPPYQGYFISVIFSKRKHFRSEIAFLHLVKSILVEISAKAFLFYHSFCLGAIGMNTNGFTIQRQSEYIHNMSSKFLGKIGVHDCDRNIIEYLVEVIKYQHIEDHFKSVRHPEVPVKPLSYHNVSCQTSKF